MTLLANPSGIDSTLGAAPAPTGTPTLRGSALSQLIAGYESLPSSHPVVTYLNERMKVIAPEDPPTVVVLGRLGLGVNAMALSSGEIVVTPELVKFVQNRDELDGVLAHELAHVRGRHTDQSENEAISNIGRRRMHEYEADAWAFRRLCEPTIESNPRGLQTFLNRIDGGTAAWDLDHGRSIDRVQALLALEANLELDSDRAPLATALLRPTKPLPTEVSKSLEGLAAGDNRVTLSRALERGELEKVKKIIESKPIELSLEFIAKDIRRIGEIVNASSRSNSEFKNELIARVELLSGMVLSRFKKDPQAGLIHFETLSNFFSTTEVMHRCQALSALRKQATQAAIKEMRLEDGGALNRLSSDARWTLVQHIFDKTEALLDAEGTFKVTAALKATERIFPANRKDEGDSRARAAFQIVSLGLASEAKFSESTLDEIKTLLKCSSIATLVECYRAVKDDEERESIAEVFGRIGIWFEDSDKRPQHPSRSVTFQKFDLTNPEVTERTLELFWHGLPEMTVGCVLNESLSNSCFPDLLEEGLAQMWLGYKWGGRNDTAVELSGKLEDCLKRFSELHEQAQQVDPLFARYYEARLPNVTSISVATAGSAEPAQSISNATLADFLHRFPAKEFKDFDFFVKDIRVALDRAIDGRPEDLINLYYCSFLLKDVAAANRLQQYAASVLAEKLSFEEYSNQIVSVALKQGAVTAALIRHLDGLISSPEQQAQALKLLGNAWNDNASSSAAGLGVLGEGVGAKTLLESKDRGDLLVTLIETQSDESRLADIVTTAWWQVYGPFLENQIFRDLTRDSAEVFFEVNPTFPFDQTILNQEAVDPKASNARDYSGPSNSLNFLPTRECINNLYGISDLQRSGIVREILVGRDGLLLSAEGRARLSEILLNYTVIDSTADSAAVLRDCVNSLINNAPSELLAFTISDLLASRILRPAQAPIRIKPNKEQVYDLAMMIPQDKLGLHTEVLLLKSPLLDDPNCLEVVRERLNQACEYEGLEDSDEYASPRHDQELLEAKLDLTKIDAFLESLFRGIPEDQIHFMIEEVCGQLQLQPSDKVSAIDPLELERIVSNAQLLKTNIENYLGQILNGVKGATSMHAELNAKLPAMQIAEIHKMEPLDLAIDVCRNIGPIGVRFLQLLGQVMPDLTDEERARLRSVYETNTQQLRGAAIETIRLVAPDQVQSLRSINANIGGGAIFSVFDVNWNGNREALRVMRPNSAANCERTFQTLDAVVNDLIAKSPNYRIARPVLGLVREWILAELNDTTFAEDDIQFRAKWDGERDSLINEWSVKVPQSQNELAPKIMIEAYVEGENLSNMANWAPERRKAAVATLMRLYAQQIQDGLVHSDVSIGNYRVTNQNQLVVLDRNMYLKLSTHDRDEISELFMCFVGDSSAEEQSKAVGKFLQYLGAPDETQSKAAAIMSDPASIKDEKSLLRALALVQSESWMMPLRFQLLVKNISSINQMANAAGFENLGEALMHS